MDLYYAKSGKRIKKYELVHEDGEESYRETKEWKEYKQEKRIKVLIESSNIPPHSLSLGLDDYIGEDRKKIDKLKIFIDKFEKKFHKIHLYFWSLENGTQKTTIASIVGKELLKKGFSVQFILMNQLINLLSEEKFNPEHTDILSPIRQTDFLIIDDSFDRKKSTIYKSGFQLPFLDQFLRTRLELDRKSTCFTSNISIDLIDESLFGSSMKQLIKRSIIDPLHFGSSYELRNNFNPEDLWS